MSHIRLSPFIIEKTGLEIKTYNAGKLSVPGEVLRLRKGVIILGKIRVTALVIIVLALLSPAILAKDYIELWPEGWSDLTPFFSTSIFADRFFVTNDLAGTSFLSVDGLYFRELDLTYRLFSGEELKEEIVLRAGAEINSAYLGIDRTGLRHVVWLERAPGKNSINYTNFGPAYAGHEIITILVTENQIQDLAAFQQDQITHVVWSERDGFFQIRYAQIEAGEVVLMETVTDSAELSVRPSVVADEQGSIHIAWMETTANGIQVNYSSRLADGWSKPRKVGDGSVQDVEQGGLITMAACGDEVYLAWAAALKNRGGLFVHLAKVTAAGELTEPQVIGAGSRPRFLQGTTAPEIVWQGVGPFGSQVNYRPHQGDTVNLSVGRKGAFRAEGFAQQEFRYVYWLQAEENGGYVVYGINNEFPKPISIWRKVGLDENAPGYHLVFLFSSTLMLAAVYTITNIGVLTVTGAIYSLLQKFGAYRRQPLLYQIGLLAALILVVRRLPIPAAHPEFFGPLHHGLSALLASVGTFLLLRTSKQRGLFLTIAILIVWMFLFQFFALIPQTILR